MIQKMSEEKGNARLVALLLLGLLLHSNTAHSTSYTVGDSLGWTFNIAGWENDKSFKAGDTLESRFVVNSNNSNATAHNVVVVDKSSYDSCSVPANAATYTSGNDQISVGKGAANYFICGIPGHCQAGMKIAANAA